MGEHNGFILTYYNRGGYNMVNAVLTTKTTGRARNEEERMWER